MSRAIPEALFDGDPPPGVVCVWRDGLCGAPFFLLWLRLKFTTGHVAHVWTPATLSAVYFGGLSEASAWKTTASSWGKSALLQRVEERSSAAGDAGHPVCLRYLATKRRSSGYRGAEINLTTIKGEGRPRSAAVMWLQEKGSRWGRGGGGGGGGQY